MATLQSSIRAEVTSGVADQVWIETLIGLGVGAAGGALRSAILTSPLTHGVLLGCLFGLAFGLFFAKRATSAGAGLVWGVASALLLWMLVPADFADVEGTRASHGHVERCPSAVSGSCSLFALPRDARGRWSGHSGRTSLKGGAATVPDRSRHRCRWACWHLWGLDFRSLDVRGRFLSPACRGRGTSLPYREYNPAVRRRAIHRRHLRDALPA